MRKLMTALLSVFSALTLLAQPSNAQDHWTGFYLGGNTSASSDRADAEAELTINQVTNITIGGPIFVIPSIRREFAASRRETSWAGGGQIGYQWQAGGFVFGAEGDFNPFHRTVSVSQSQQLPPTLITQPTTAEFRRDVRLSREFSIRARAGVAFGKTLVYGTVGYGQARVRVSSIDTFTNPGGATLTTPSVNLGPSGPVVTAGIEEQNMGGWTGGFGVERKIGGRVGIGFEYRRTDFRSKSFALANRTTVNTGPAPVGTNGVAGIPGGFSQPTTQFPDPTRLSLKSDSFGVRVNFHF